MMKIEIYKNPEFTIDENSNVIRSYVMKRTKGKFKSTHHFNYIEELQHAVKYYQTGFEYKTKLIDKENLMKIKIKPKPKPTIKQILFGDNLYKTIGSILSLGWDMLYGIVHIIIRGFIWAILILILNIEVTSFQSLIGFLFIMQPIFNLLFRYSYKFRRQ